MPEPNTPNVGLIVPNTGDQVGTWGSASINPDMVAIDGLFGGSQTVSVTGGSLSLGLPSGSISPTAGPTQSQNSHIYFTGTLTSNQTVVLGMPGRYSFINNCGNAFLYYLQIASSNGGATVGLPPGEFHMVFHDGTNVYMLDLPHIGAHVNLSVSATYIGYPIWMYAFPNFPYLIRDGSVYNISQYPILGQWLGATFGGNGSSTFAVPDSRARADIAYDTGNTGRLSGASGVTGTTMGSNGGSEFLQSHNHSASVSDPGHLHAISPQAAQNVSGGGNNPPPSLLSNPGASQTQTATTGISVSIGSNGSGDSQNVQPSIVSYLPFIRAG
jgi:microcystin-dependent protein